MIEFNTRLTDIHCKYKEFINIETFKFLNDLFRLASINLDDFDEEDTIHISECFKKVKAFVLYNDKNDKKMFNFESNVEKVWDIADIKLKSYIYYCRCCKMIEVLISEYREMESSVKKRIIDYYLFDNRLKELCSVGISSYYHCKYNKGKTTLFRSEGGKTLNWDKQGLIGKLPVDTLKDVFNYCREHINKGNYKILLRSYSKCFWIVLFKYLSIPEGKESVNLRIRQNSDINIIRYHNEVFSLQDFIQQDRAVDCSIDFCVDISSPRDDNRENLKIWMDEFLGKDSTNIQSYISPVSDKEVIMSYKPSNVVNFTFGQSTSHSEEDMEWEFVLNSKELIHLLFKYYSKYAGQEETLKSYIKNKCKKDYEIHEDNEGFHNYIHDCITDVKEEETKKIDKILSLIEWESEYIDSEKDLTSVYKNNNENHYINKFKKILQGFIAEERGKGI